MDTWHLQVCGIITLVFLTVLPTLVPRSLKRILGIDILQGSYRDNLLKCTKEQNVLMRLQKIGVVLSFLVLRIVVHVTSKIIFGKDLFQQTEQPVQWIGLAVAIAFMVVIICWGLGSYSKIGNAALQFIKNFE